jgi:hypothetical protein
MDYFQVKRFANSRTNYLIAYLWGLAEGIFFFIIPDVYIGFITLIHISAGLKSLIFVLAGGLTSVTLIYLFPWLADLIQYIPGVTGQMIGKVNSDLQTFGSINVIMGPLSGIPYKIYSAQAVKLQLPFAQFFLWSIPARLERTIVIFVIASIISRFGRYKIQSRIGLVIGLYLVMWLVIYLLYYLALYR